MRAIRRPRQTRLCMQVHIFHHSPETTRCIALELSTMLPNYHTYVNKQV